MLKYNLGIKKVFFSVMDFVQSILNTHGFKNILQKIGYF